jgi:tRNA threonylcarbamoyl adenosine modification protein YeaZ/ribosomal-protein-alanine acetyltransferase
VFLIALDTCDSRGSVAVLRDAHVLHTVVHESSEDYSVWLLPAVQEALRTARIALSNIDVYAVASGPGSFTGVRVGLATVKAWAEVYGRPIAAVSRLEALATQAPQAAPYVAAFADGRRSQLFAAMYRLRDRGLERIEEEMVIAPERFVAWAAETAEASRIEWISSEPQFVVETPVWASRQAVGETVQTVSPFLAPAIGRLGHRLAIEGKLTDALSLDANYVRRTDAEVLWKDESKRQASPERKVPNAVVRKFTPQDADAAHEIATRSPEAAQWSRESYASLNDHGQLGWVAEANGTICGFFVARIVGDEAEILNLAVDPARKRTGIASTLWNEAVGEFRRRKTRSAFLEVRESNIPALRFYEKQGFARTGLRPAYYREPAEAAVLMMRELTG